MQERRRRGEALTELRLDKGVAAAPQRRLDADVGVRRFEGGEVAPQVVPFLAIGGVCVFDARRGLLIRRRCVCASSSSGSAAPAPPRRCKCALQIARAAPAHPGQNALSPPPLCAHLTPEELPPMSQ